MVVAWVSLAALVAVIAVSCVSRLNVGLLAIALAWVIGVYVAPWYGLALDARSVLAGFPAELFVTLLGVTLLFTLAGVNGTLEQVARAAVGCCRGRAALVAPMFFALAAGLSTLGAGNIAAAALVAPMAAAVAERLGISRLLMVIAVGHGAIAGGLSPFTPMGVIANTLLARMDLAGHEWTTYALNLAANLLVASGGYVLLRGWRAAAGSQRAADLPALVPGGPTHPPFRAAHAATLAVIGLLVAGVVGLGAHVGLAAFAAAALLIVLRLSDQQRALGLLPWGVMVMVTGMTMLVSVLEKTGGLELFTDVLSRLATQRTLVPLMALVTGVISVFSSTSGVVLPTFLPTARGLAERLGGDPLAVATAINIGSSIVDVSPVSTIGALCVAPLSVGEGRGRLFRGALAWGLSMAVVGGVVSWLLVG